MLKLLENGENVDVMYLDFAKAFDKVDLGILVIKLIKLGIKGALLRWIASFILGRRQAVKVGSKISSWSSVHSGIPQGSVLGPLLFLIFIADLGIDLNQDITLILKYVDDTKCIQQIRNEEDVELLQVSLDQLYKWQEENNMKFNGDKFQVLRLGKHQVPKGYI